MPVQQLTLNFDAGMSEAWGSCREMVQAIIHQQPISCKAIAADMDYAPSTLSRKLSQSPHDTQRFTLDDLERFIQITGDCRPVYYLVERYLTDRRSELDKLKAEVARLERLQYNKAHAQ
jgi:hypothetical protein